MTTTYNIPLAKPYIFDILPKVQEFRLSNGSPLYYIEGGNEEVVKIEFIFNAGIIAEDHPLIASTTNSMLLEGTINHSAKQINEMIDFHGAHFGTSFDSDHAGIVAMGLTRHFEKLIELGAELLFTSDFPEEELSLFLDRRLESFKIHNQRVSHIARVNFQEMLFGSDHPFGRRVNEKHFKEVTAGRLSDFHSRIYNPAGLLIIVAGRMPENGLEVVDKLIGSFNCHGCYAPRRKMPLTETSPGKLRIKRKDTVQSAIKVGCRTINKNNPDYHGLKIVGTILGGYFGSRLMKSIREDKGYSYGVSAGTTSMLDTGMFTINTEVGKQYVKETRELIYSELRSIRQAPVGNDELNLVRNYLTGEILRLFDGPFTTSETFRSVHLFGLTLDYFNKMLIKVKNIEPDEIIYLAETYLSEEKMIEVIAG